MTTKKNKPTAKKDTTIRFRASDKEKDALLKVAKKLKAKSMSEAIRKMTAKELRRKTT